MRSLYCMRCAAAFESPRFQPFCPSCAATLDKPAQVAVLEAATFLTQLHLRRCQYEYHLGGDDSVDRFLLALSFAWDELDPVCPT